MPTTSNNSSNTHIPFAVQVRFLQEEWDRDREQQTESERKGNLAVDTACPAAVEMSVTAPTLPASRDQSEESLAHEIHEAYCRKVGPIDYSLFESEWIAAAALVRKLDADVENYLQAQHERHIGLDPEDLGSSVAADVYGKFMKQRDRDIYETYLYMERSHPVQCRESQWDPVRSLISPMLPFSASFRVFGALAYGADDRDMNTILDLYGREALRELHDSPRLQEHLRSLWDMPPEIIVEGLVARITAIEQEAAAKAKAAEPGGAA